MAVKIPAAQCRFSSVKKTMTELPDGFNITEQRIYKIPQKHTFFGIHYQKPEGARGKINLHERGLGGAAFRALNFAIHEQP